MRVICVEHRTEEGWEPARPIETTPAGKIVWPNPYGENWRTGELGILGSPSKERYLPHDMSDQLRSYRRQFTAYPNFMDSWFTIPEAREAIIRDELNLSDPDLQLDELEAALALHRIQKGISDLSDQLLTTLDRIEQDHAELPIETLRCVVWFQEDLETYQRAHGRPPRY